MDKLNDLFTKIITKLNKKVDSVEGKGLSSNDYTAAEKTKLSGIATGAEVNKIESVKLNGSALPIDEQKAVNIDLSDYATDSELSTGLSGKVDKQDGKRLSTEDFTTAYKNKLDGIPEGGGGGEVNIINTVKVNGTALVPDAEKAVDVKAYNEDNKPKVGGRNLLILKDLESGGLNNNGTENDIALAKRTGYIAVTTGEVFALQGWCDKLSESQIETIYIKIVFYDENKTFLSFHAAWDNGLNGYCTTECTAPEGSAFYRIAIKSEPSAHNVKYKVERGNIPTDWSPAPEDLETTAENFEGILPIEKGGTGNNLGYIPVVFGNEIRPSFGNENETLHIGFINGWRKYSFYTNETTAADITCGKINSPSIPSIATASTAGLVKPGAGLQVSEDGTLSLSQETLQQMIDNAVQKALSP